ncbi:MAG: 1-acyl-sn-glycerol-3-phosphate acyltransferase [Candidatus Omnitrophica bacterium]|nr:1-acyl-sn-glycerol-3-phosphate acyltransferase [Candidatus Omnitrophota bacterium]MCM8770921.1 1-acyl-sn-glycerol-3-phosphate acyltransferase [Candidatus Omnitrophota bacterium]
MLYRILRLICVLIFKIFFRIKVSGRNNIPKKGGFILASNHLSFLDPVVLGVAAVRQLNFFARHDLFKNPFFSWLISSLGAFPVVRDTADKSALKEALRRLQDGKALVVFPAGTRGGLEPQPGIGFLATKAEVPVIPAFIQGTEKALPKGTTSIKFTPLAVRFGEPILIDKGKSYEEIAKKIMIGINQLA